MVRLLVFSLLLAPALALSAAEKKSGEDAEVAAIRAAIDSYVAAYNKGDAKAVAAHWSEDGHWISPTGERAEGVAAIRSQLEEVFAKSKDVRIEVLQPSIRLVTPDVALEEGRVRVIRRGETTSESTYVAIHVKKDGKWKLDSVRETELPEEVLPNTLLRELAWLTGSWRDASSKSKADTVIAWTKNKAFLTYSFRVSSPDMDDLEGTQVIGWDPTTETIRSWMFDSDGGFGEGVWTQKDNQWIVKFRQVLPDGRVASATNIYTIIDANTFTWKSIGRKVGDEFLPNVQPIKMVRQTADAAVSKPSKPAKQPVSADVKK